ncbi:MAG TPA: small ribosomal subunit Rsm22 family protein [Lacunisphaera sp.]|nr:small ribosomal subunit Rsm22 family protein [Lacunisphaera sp.]
MNWESLDWDILDRLRAAFLSGAAAHGPYWHTITDLECYNFTFGQRIAWKWDAVLTELRLRGWRPPAGGTVLDWGCGSGIAGRQVVGYLGAENVARLVVHDHSQLAMDFSAHHAARVFPGLAVERADAAWLKGREPIGVLVLSHVLNELHDVDLAALGVLINRAASVVWVEPGNHEVSRVLGHWRKRLLGPFRVVAPCPHQGACGILAAGNEQHWCHFFAPVPSGIHADSGWVKFGQRAGIDLRSLPYSFVALERNPVAVGRALGPTTNQVGDEPRPTSPSRLLGEPRVYKGYAKLFSCDASGVAELTLPKRTDPGLFKALKQGGEPRLFCWTRDGTTITGVEANSS